MLRKGSGKGDARDTALRLVARARRAVAGREAVLVAALLVFGGLWAFGVLAEDLLTGDPLVQVDRRLAGWLHDRATPGLTTAFEAVTTIGSAWVIVPLALATVLGLLARTRKAEALFLALVLVGAEGLTLILKAGFERQRPFFADPLASESSFSFPSGHATVSLAVFGALGFLLARRSPSWRGRALWIGAAAVLVLLIGASRLFLGVHFLSDVLAGYSAGMVWLVVCAVGIFRPRRRTEDRESEPE